MPFRCCCEYCKIALRMLLSPSMSFVVHSLLLAIAPVNWLASSHSIVSWFPFNNYSLVPIQ
jgi:hypothetical protein